jgi:hypothetical protein
MRRTLYTLGNIRIHLDAVRGLGRFSRGRSRGRRGAFGAFVPHRRNARAGGLRLHHARSLGERLHRLVGAAAPPLTASTYDPRFARMSPVIPTAGCVPAPEALAHQTRAWATPLVDRIGAQLHAMYLYGSALGSDFDAAASDVNVLLVTESLAMDRLIDYAQSLSALRSEVELRFAPLFLTRAQIADSADVFPIEFLDLTRRRALLAGTDVMAGVRVRRAHLRHQCEYELRAQLVGLRRAVLRSGAAPATAWALLAQVAGSTPALCRSLLLLQDETPPDSATAAIEAAAHRFGVRAEFLAAPLVARRQGAVAASDPAGPRRLGDYLDELEKLIAAVDALPIA